MDIDLSDYIGPHSPPPIRQAMRKRTLILCLRMSASGQ
jgi:hypothetical protein